jgi:acetyltransferase
VLCAGDCASEGLNVLALPDETIAALDKVFPPRWSRRNPVDPAGDRNFIGYLTAPEKLLQVENVDSLIFVGFGGFSTFAPTMFSMDSNVGAGLAEMIPAISTAFESQDVAEISKIISPAIATIGSAMGTHDEEIQRLTRLIASAIAARRIAPLFQSISPSLPGSSEAENVGAKETMSASEAIAGFMFGLVEQWIADYGKPVLTTTFGEGTPQLSSSRFVYPSSRAAARVLVKMVEYKEYLERIGIYQK